MPRRQRCSGGKRVMSAPLQMTRPESGATVPLAMPNSVVLPAPFGPMIPSASPSASARSIASATTTAPNRFEIFSSASIAGTRGSYTPGGCRPRESGDAYSRGSGHGSHFRGNDRIERTRLRQQLQLAAHGDLGRAFVGGDDQVELVALALPLPRNQWGLGHVLHRLPGPLHRTDDRLVIGRHDRIENGF